MKSNQLKLILLAVLTLRALGISADEILAAFVCAVVGDCVLHDSPRIQAGQPPSEEEPEPCSANAEESSMRRAEPGLDPDIVA
jgi:hypothetical protein